MNKLPTMEEITSLYLYGQPIPPKNKIDTHIISRKREPYSVSAQMFMNGPGRFARASDFEYVNKFFNENYQISAYRLKPGEYSKAEVMKHFGLDRGWVSLTLAMYDDGKDDLIERAYIWNTSAFMLDDKARFVVEPDGRRYIKDFAIRPYKNENFDFVGGRTSEMINFKLQREIDPEGIGRKVEITFSGNLKTRTLTEEGYRIEQNKSSHWSLINGARVGMASGLNLNGGIIDRLEKSGVLYHHDERKRQKRSDHQKHSFDYNNADWNNLNGSDLYAAVLSADSSQLDMLGKSLAQSEEGQRMLRQGENLLAEYKEQQELERQQELVHSSRAMVRTL